GASKTRQGQEENVARQRSAPLRFGGMTSATKGQRRRRGASGALHPFGAPSALSEKDECHGGCHATTMNQGRPVPSVPRRTKATSPSPLVGEGKGKGTSVTKRAAKQG